MTAAETMEVTAPQDEAEITMVRHRCGHCSQPRTFKRWLTARELQIMCWASAECEEHGG